MTKEQIEYVKNCINTNVHNFYIWSEWQKVRTQVLLMDKFECQDCKKRGRYTKANTVHHHQFLKKYPELALEIFYEFKGKRYRNLISLCHDCHEARHGYRKKEEKKLLTEERWD